MPPEPKKPIEELLEASARMRRAEFGGDPKMPNPMRARLQDEIAKLSRGGEPAPRSRWFAMSWPRLAMGAACASLVLGAAAIWWQIRQIPNAGARYATQDRLEAEARPAAPSSRRMPAAAESGKLADAKVASEGQRSLQTFSETAARSAGAAADSAAQKSEADAANLTQQFSQFAAAKANASEARLQQAPKILDNFQVEQNGRDFRVVDGDGSTYTGRIERLAPNDARNLSKQKQSDAGTAAPTAASRRAKASTEAPDNEFYFRASGYNDSLKKSLVFEGNYIVAASQPPRRDRGAASAKSDEQMAARIVGTAKVPGEPSMPVEAVTVPSK